MELSLTGTGKKWETEAKQSLLSGGASDDLSMQEIDEIGNLRRRASTVAMVVGDAAEPNAVEVEPLTGVDLSRNVTLAPMKIFQSVRGLTVEIRRGDLDKESPYVKWGRVGVAFAVLYTVLALLLWMFIGAHLRFGEGLLWTFFAVFTLIAGAFIYTMKKLKLPAPKDPLQLSVATSSS